MNKKILVPLCAALAFIFLTAEDCDGPADPQVESDSNQAYADGSKVPTDLQIYTVTGTVAGDVESLTRQVKPGGGSTPTCFGTSGCYGGGSFFGPIEKGKGYVRLRVNSVSPATESAKEGSLTILKVTDTKATALLPGDTVTFKCRRQYEAIAAVQQRQKFDRDKDGTWELDYCRLSTPTITVKPAP